METRTIPPYHLITLGTLEENFHSAAAKFMHIMHNGGGLKNMSLGETLNGMYYMYLQIAAHLDAARDVNGQVTIETGRRALALMRSMAAEDENKPEE